MLNGGRTKNRSSYSHDGNAIWMSESRQNLLYLNRRPVKKVWGSNSFPSPSRLRETICLLNKINTITWPRLGRSRAYSTIKLTGEFVVNTIVMNSVWRRNIIGTCFTRKRIPKPWESKDFYSNWTHPTVWFFWPIGRSW